jgi:hypothetical protein
MCGAWLGRMLRAMKARTVTFLAVAVACLIVAAPATADSISYIKDGNVWLSTADGARQFQVTQSGIYSYASQADDGTILAMTGQRLHRLSRSGQVLADFDTPVSDGTSTEGSYFSGPFEPEISPDGTKVVYEYAWKLYDPTDPNCRPPFCVGTRIEVGVAYSHANRQTAWDEAGFGRQSGWVDPSWIDNGHTLLSDKAVRYGNLNAFVDTMGDGPTTHRQWFEDDGSWYLRDGEMTRQQTKLAFVGTRPKSTGEDLTEDDQIRIYRMNGPAPRTTGDPSNLPEPCYTYSDPKGQYESPSWSPDGSRIAFTDTGQGYANPEIYVADVPDLSAGCQIPSEAGKVVIPGGRYPDWGPADVPGNPVTPPPDDRRGRQLKLVLPRGAKLAAALRKGIVLTVSPGQAGKAVGTAKVRKAKVARGATRVGPSGTAKLRLRFTAKAKRSLRREKSVRLAIRIKFTPKGGGAAQAAAAALKLKR